MPSCPETCYNAAQVCVAFSAAKDAIMGISAVGFVFQVSLAQKLAEMVKPLASYLNTCLVYSNGDLNHSCVVCFWSNILVSVLTCPL